MSESSRSNAKRRRDSVASVHAQLEGADTEAGRPQKISKTDVEPDNDPRPPAPEIASLLDFSSLTSFTDISGRFDDIANAFFRDYQLVVTNGEVQTAFQVLEMEFYLRKPGVHEDPFTHGSEEQKKSGQWYFHRSPRSSTFIPTDTAGYRSGSRKGLDLTFGIPVIEQPSTSSQDATTGQTRGGILLRTLRRVSDRKVISGPSLLVDEILRLSGVAEIHELVQQKWSGNIAAWPSPSADRTSSSTSLYLEKRSNMSTLKAPSVYRSPRIGLDLSHSSVKNSLTNPRVVYVSKPYRYFIHPELLTANGRAQTFIGIYQTCIASGRNKTSDFGLRRDIARLGGFTDKTADKYMAEYKRGFENGSLSTFIGTAGKGASSSPGKCLALFGTLARLQVSDSHNDGQ